MKSLLISALIAVAVQANAQIFTSEGVQSIKTLTQHNAISDGPGKYGFGPLGESNTDIVDPTMYLNPDPEARRGTSLYTEGDCWEASNVFKSWAWGTYESKDHLWIQVVCPPCLLDCLDRQGSSIECKCYRLVPKRIANFTFIPVVTKPVERIIYRA